MRREGLLNFSCQVRAGIRRPMIVRHGYRNVHTLGQLLRSIRERDLYDFNRHLSTLVPVVGGLAVASYLALSARSRRWTWLVMFMAFIYVDRPRFPRR